ncbi:MAG: hypothetical protein EA357_09315 [Micavibrio sp.]|nr:MAG: hypothetical protein EA357_09315 [Micavibrio sp.]
MLLFSNPEIRRYLWSEFTLLRLIAVPAALLAMFLVGLLKAGAPSTHFLLTVFALVVIYRGTVVAGRAFREEVRNKTWDFQRTSSISPLQLAIGKVLGSTSYIWYCGFWIYFAAWYAGGLNVENFNVIGSALIAAGIIGHLTAFAHNVAFQKFSSLIGICAAAVTYWAVTRMLGAGVDEVLWYRFSFSRSMFYFFSVVFFSVWVFRAGVCMLRWQMQYRNLPLDWGLFVVTFGAYFAGFFYEAWAQYFAFYISMLFCVYLAFFLEAGNLSGYKRFYYAGKEGQIWRSLENMPRWVLPLFFAVIVLLLFSQSYALHPTAALLSHQGSLTVFLVAALFFVLRDGLFLHWLFLGEGGRKYTGFKLFAYYFFLYFLFPAIVMQIVPASVAGDMWTRFIHSVLTEDMTVPMQPWSALTLFYPSWHPKLVYAVLPVFVQCLALGGLLFLKIRRLRNRNI